MGCATREFCHSGDMNDATLENGSDLTHRLRDYIARQGFRPGDRLPPERTLIDELGVNRGALRRELMALERQGTIWRRVGKGTFLAGGEETEAAGMGRQMPPPRMMQARLCLEPALAREAAIHASSLDIAEIDRILDQSETDVSWAEYEQHDNAFHAALACACDNAFLVSTFERLNAVRRAVVWREVTRSTSRPPADHPSHTQHRRIAEAIRTRDADGAWHAMRDHLRSVADRLFP